MFASTNSRLVLHAFPFRWTARASAVLLVAVWLLFVINEMAEPNYGIGTQTVGQATALAIVFVGYAIGWRNELLGGLTAVAGTLTFFIVVAVTTATMPGLAVLLFALPGVLYLLAWYYNEPRHVRLR
jgi:hypothetical protein